MAARALRILLVEESPADSRKFQAWLSQPVGNFIVKCVACVAAAVRSLEEADFDLVLLDLKPPDVDGLAACQSLLGLATDVPFVILSDTKDDDLGVAATLLGAQDYLCKDVADREHLIRSIHLAHARHTRSATRPSHPLPIRKQERLPSWDSESRELTFGGVLVKHLLRPAINQERILSAFEEEQWLLKIDDPLPPREGIDKKERLRATIRSLNRHHLHELVRFSADGTGAGVRWTCVASPHTNVRAAMDSDGSQTS